MLNKTTSFIFNKYGEIVNELTKLGVLQNQHANVVKLKEKVLRNSCIMIVMYI